MLAKINEYACLQAQEHTDKPFAVVMESNTKSLGQGVLCHFAKGKAVKPNPKKTSKLKEEPSNLMDETAKELQDDGISK